MCFDFFFLHPFFFLKSLLLCCVDSRYEKNNVSAPMCDIAFFSTKWSIRQRVADWKLVCLGEERKFARQVIAQLYLVLNTRKQFSCRRLLSSLSRVFVGAVAKQLLSDAGVLISQL